VKVKRSLPRERKEREGRKPRIYVLVSFIGRSQTTAGFNGFSTLIRKEDVDTGWHIIISMGFIAQLNFNFQGNYSSPEECFLLE
jgi:hypothetical protein